MKKTDLKTGMRVEYRNGEERLVDGLFLINEKRHNTIVNYNDDLTNCFNKDMDIVRVIEVSKCVLWERQEVPEYVELLWPQCGYKRGDIGKVVNHNEQGYEINVIGRYSESLLAPNVHYGKDQVKPSTKAAYDEFNAKMAKESELVDGEIYTTQCREKWVTRLKSKTENYSALTPCDGYFRVFEGWNNTREFKPATPKQRAKLIKAELKHGYLWDEKKKELIKFK